MAARAAGAVRAVPWRALYRRSTDHRKAMGGRLSCLHEGGSSTGNGLQNCSFVALSPRAQLAT